MSNSNESKQSQKQIFKIMLLGDISTGKTSFITQLMYQSAQKMPKTTTQLSFFTLRISTASKPIVVQIWDSPGDQKYHFKTLSLLQNFKAIILFIDVTNQYTFNRSKIVLQQLKVYPQLNIYLIQTKLDIVQKMPYKRKVSQNTLQELASAINTTLFHYVYQQTKTQSIIEQIVISNSNQTNIKKQNDKRIFKLKNTQNKLKSQNNKNTKQTQSQFCQCSIS